MEWALAGEGGHFASGLELNWIDGRPAVAEIHPLQVTLKRVTDLALTALALALAGPLMISVALAVKLTSPGPVLFRQPRIGLGGRRFDILKFRTMHADRCDLGGTVQPAPGDERITRVGAFLRRTSLDELPQLFNVLLGDMSLVGPRPYVEQMEAGGAPYRMIAPYFAMRHQMRPGLTGWAQANGLRGPTRDRGRALERLHHDIAYIQHFSLLLDLRILAMTARREFLNGNGL